MVIYQGPSMLMEGREIVCIATGFERASRNIKTGPMIQTWGIKRVERTKAKCALRLI